jgi:N-acetyl-beta-hexosaminidase
MPLRGWSAIPNLGSAPGPYQIVKKWGVFDGAMDPTREETYQFLDKFLGEMTALFPDAYFHIGGDECDGKEWDANYTHQGVYERAWPEGRCGVAGLLYGEAAEAGRGPPQDHGGLG